jgi:tRNA1(Val) A37 N6-methylase TrmN6
MTTLPDETIDELRGYGLRVAQKSDGYRFSLDPLLLADFARAGSCDRVIDLGTGCGIIPLLMARQATGAQIVGVELQQELADLATRNAALNGLAGRIAVLLADVTALRRHFPVSSFDLVVANPPYRVPGSGRISPKAGRDLARHESTAGLADFLAAAKYLVRPNGRLCFVYHPSRLPELLTAAALLKLAPLRLRMVHDSEAAEAGMFLVELVKGRKGTFTVQAPLLVRTAQGGYSTEMIRILGGDAC